MQRANWSLAFAVVFVLVARACAVEHISEPFLGVRHIERIDTLPRPLYSQIVEIDLAEPTLSFRVTPRGPSPQPIFGGIPDETITQTTRQFLDGVGGQVAINASFFAAVHSGGWTNNLGLTASNGDKYSPWESPFTANFDDALNITQTNEASIVKMPASIPTGFETTPVVPLYNTVTGSHRLLANGTNVAPPPGADSLTQLHPRTAVGVTANHKLVMMTVDGRQPGFSEGVTLVELANLLGNYGVVDAINLDGGGSSTLAFNYYGDTNSSGIGYNSRLINSPVGNSNNLVATERTVGANLAVFAAANPAFVPPTAPPAVPVGITVLDDFEVTEGHFAGGPTASGSTFGVSSNSQIDRVLNESYAGMGSQRITIQSSNPVTPGLAVRHLSGDGAPSSNLALPATGYVGFFLKVLDTGVQSDDITASLVIDDGNEHEQAMPINVVADGDWHLYQWNLEVDAQWQSFAAGNGQIDAATVTVDSLFLSSNQNLNFNIFFDLLAHNPGGTLNALVPQTPGDFDADGDVDGADFVVWQIHFPQTSGATIAMGDADGDGDVDGADFVVWQTHFPTGGAAGLAHAVPEPNLWRWIASGCLIRAAGCLVCRRSALTTYAVTLCCALRSFCSDWPTKYSWSRVRNRSSVI